MVKRRVLSCVLLLCFICSIVCVGVSAAQGDVIGEYTDSGLGWWVKSDFYLYTTDSSINFRPDGTTEYKKASDGSAIRCLTQKGNSYFLYFFSTVQSFTSKTSGSSITTSPLFATINGVNWYCSVISAYSASLGAYNMPVFDISGFSGGAATLTAILDFVGYTTVQPELPQPSTHFVECFNNSPLQVTYRVSGSGSLSTVYLNGTYPVRNDYSNDVLSVPSLNTFNNGLSVGPLDGLVSYQYLCYQPVSFPQADYSSVSVSGDFSFKVHANDGRAVKPADVMLFVNDTRLQSNGLNYNSFTGALSVDLSLDTSIYGDITKVGIWAAFTDSVPVSNSADSLSVYFDVDDNLVFNATSGSGSSSGSVTDDIASDTSGILGGIGIIFQNLIDLPSKIGNLLLSLFVPSSEDVVNVKSDFEDLINSRLGFVGQVVTWLSDLFTSVHSSLENASAYQFVFPGISFPMNGQTYQIVESQTVSLDNDFMSVVRPVLGTIVSIVCTLSFVNVAESAFIAIWSGTSYFDWLMGRKQSG